MCMARQNKSGWQCITCVSSYNGVMGKKKGQGAWQRQLQGTPLLCVKLQEPVGCQTHQQIPDM